MDGEFCKQYCKGKLEAAGINDVTNLLKLIAFPCCYPFLPLYWLKWKEVNLFCADLQEPVLVISCMLMQIVKHNSKSPAFPLQQFVMCIMLQMSFFTEVGLGPRVPHNTSLFAGACCKKQYAPLLNSCSSSCLWLSLMNSFQVSGFSVP